MIEIKYEGTDITADVEILTARFISQVNGNPGSFSLRVKDAEQAYEFISGGEMTLDIDSVRMWGGYVTKAQKAYPLTVMDTTDEDAVARYWSLQGVDYNILFTKRIIYDSADPTGKLSFDYPVGTYDDDIVLDLFDNYLDIGADGLSSAGVERVSIVTLDIPGVTSGKGTLTKGRGQVASAGYTWKQAMDVIARATGAVYYIDPSKVFHYVDDDSADASVGLSDAPGGGQIGYQNFNLLENGANLVNDMLVWGAASGSDNIVFSRSQDSASQTAHNVWQGGLYSQGLYQQASADLVADSYLYGTPQNLRGGKDNAINFTCRVFEPVLNVGQKVELECLIFDYTDVIPIRRMEIRFVNPNEATFDLSLSHDIDQPWSIFEQQFPSFNFGFGVKPVRPPKIYPPVVEPGEEGCPDLICGITDNFNSLVSTIQGNSQVGVDFRAIPSYSASSGFIWQNGYVFADDAGSALPVEAYFAVDPSDGFAKYHVSSHDGNGYGDIYNHVAFGRILTNLQATVRARFVNVDMAVESGAEGSMNFFGQTQGSGQVWLEYIFGAADPGDTRSFLQIRHRDPTGATVTTIDTFDWVPDDDTWYTFRIDFTAGGTCQAKVWADGDPEPGTWTLSGDSTGLGSFQFNAFDIEMFAPSFSAAATAATDVWVDDLDIEGIDACTKNQFDDFNRTNNTTVQWGLASGGSAWVGAGPGTSQRSVTPGEGRFTQNSLAAGGGGGGQARITTATQPEVWGGDFELRTSFKILSASASQEAFQAIGVTEFATGAVINHGLYITKNDGGVTGDDDYSFVESGVGVLATVSTTWVLNTWYNVRFQREGLDYRIKVWAFGTAEPSGWTIEVTVGTAIDVDRFSIMTVRNSSNLLTWGMAWGPMYFTNVDGSISICGCGGGTGVIYDDFDRADADDVGQASSYVSGSTTPYTWTTTDATNGTYNGEAELKDGAIRLYTPSMGPNLALATIRPTVTVDPLMSAGTALVRLRHRLKFAKQDTTHETTTPFFSAVYGRISLAIETGATISGTTGRGLEFSSGGSTPAPNSMQIRNFQLQTDVWYVVRAEQTLNTISRLKIWREDDPEPASWLVYCNGPPSGLNRITFFIDGGSADEPVAVDEFEVFIDDIEFQVEDECTEPSEDEGVTLPLSGRVCETAERIDSTTFQLSRAFIRNSSEVRAGPAGSPGPLARRGITYYYTEDPESGQILTNDPVDAGWELNVCYEANGYPV